VIDHFKGFFARVFSTIGALSSPESLLWQKEQDVKWTLVVNEKEETISKSYVVVVEQSVRPQ